MLECVMACASGLYWGELAFAGDSVRLLHCRASMACVTYEIRRLDRDDIQDLDLDTSPGCSVNTTFVMNSRHA